MTSRKEKKEDTTTHSYRNRLFAQCKNAVKLKSGGLPSPIKGLVELSLRVWSNIRYGQNRSLGLRDRVITVGLKKVLNEHVDSKAASLTGEIMEERFILMSNYCSQVRVKASLFANFIHMKAFMENNPIAADEKFYSQCLILCRGSKPNGKDPTMVDLFKDFESRTGLHAEPKMQGVSTLFERQVWYVYNLKIYCRCFILICISTLLVDFSTGCFNGN